MLWLQRKGFQTSPIGVVLNSSMSVSKTDGGGANPSSLANKEMKMSAETMTVKLTDDLKGKSDVLNSKIADLSHKMDVVFTDAHVAVDEASAHVEKVAAAVARLKETLPT